MAIVHLSMKKNQDEEKNAPPTYNNGDVVDGPCVFVDIYWNTKINLYRDCNINFNNVKTHRKKSSEWGKLSEQIIITL